MTNKDHFFETEGGKLSPEVREAAKEYGLSIQENYRGFDVVKIEDPDEYEDSDGYEDFVRERLGDSTIQQRMGQEFHNFAQVKRRLEPSVAADGGNVPDPTEQEYFDQMGDEEGYVHREIRVSDGGEFQEGKPQGQTMSDVSHERENTPDSPL